MIRLGTCARAIDDVRHPTSFESRVDACRTPRYIYIYKILCLILWLQRCSGAALACVGSTDLFACTFVGTMVGTYPIRTV
jgi:hypothetical protein